MASAMSGGGGMSGIATSMVPPPVPELPEVPPVPPVPPRPPVPPVPEVPPVPTVPPDASGGFGMYFLQADRLLAASTRTVSQQRKCMLIRTP